MTRTRVAVLGSANMDIATVTARLPSPGQTVLGRSLSTSQGGKGANQAIASARSGAVTTFLGAVGDDAYAERLLADMAEAGVDTGLTRRERGPSGVAVITVDEKGENTIVVVTGANDALTALTGAESAAIGDADVLLCQFEIPIVAVTAGAVHARANGRSVMLNPSPVADIPDDLLNAVDVLVVNESEARELGAAVLARVPHVVTTVGADGAHYVGPRESFHVSAPTVKAVDTTGAGDAFTGALAAEWPKGPREAIRWACAAGALAATRHGAGASSGTRDEIARLLDS